MSDPVVTEASVDANLPGSPGQKRKRDPNSPSLQRAKRAAPPANMGVTSGDTAAYIESAIQATEAAAANGVNVADFNALQQAAQEEAADPATATSTAQAALGMYPTLHVPPSTEEQFAAQAAAEAAEQAHEAVLNATPDMGQQQGQQQPPQQQQSPPDGLMEDQTQPQPPQQQQVPQSHQQPMPLPTPTNGAQEPGGPRFAAAQLPKPTVGSEEWHKMRKDNHKEGESPEGRVLAMSSY
jgi:hypothetical protein